LIPIYERLQEAFPFHFNSSLLIGLACIAAVASYLVGSSVYVSETRNQARTVADMVDNFGQWATRYRGVWVKDDPAIRNSRSAASSSAKLSTAPVANDSTTAPNAAAFHRKNPALVQRELSDITIASPAKAKFRMTSDRYMNPNNAPSEFDKVAMNAIRDRALRIQRSARRPAAVCPPAGCRQGLLRCHGAPAAAPAAVTALYPGPQGYGYEEGKLAGVISVAIPLSSAWPISCSASTTRCGWPSRRWAWASPACWCSSASR
jgi:hypothetical protein